MKHHVYRVLAALAVVALIVTACTTPPTPAPATQPPAAVQPTEQKPAEVKPTEAQPAEVKPTEAPAQPTSKYGEAPQLAEEVKAGKLPPVEDRLPQEPLVVEGAEGVGQYGGTWRRGFTGPSDFNGYVRVVYDGLVRFSPDGTKVEPKVALGWENSADFKEWTILLREGAKWSDGSPLTADDILFWYNDVLLNQDITPSLPKWMRNADGSVALVEKVNDYAVKFTYAEQNTLFLYELANQDGGDRTYAPFLPAHYLKQFHPTYGNQADIDKLVADAKFQTWTELFASKNAPFENPERPTMAAWVPASRISDQVFTLKRNPYYVGVDTAGNQLPYLDEVRFTFFADAQALNLAAIAGELDQQDRHVNMMNYPVLKENEGKGQYRVITWPSFGGADAVVMFNQTYQKDPELGQLMQNRDFRIAMSHAIDRSQIQESAFLGLGEPRQAVAAPWHPYYPGDEVAQRYTEFDQAKANELLDSIGLDKKNAEGYRLYQGTETPVTIEISVVPAFGPWPDVAQLIAQNWEEVGIKTIVQVRERALHFQMRSSNDLQTEIWNEDTGGFPFTGAPKYDPRIGGGNAGLTLAPLVRQWYATDGKEGVEPTPEMKRIVEIMDKAKTVGPEEQIKLAKELYDHWTQQMYEIGIIGLSPMVQGVAVVNNNLMNVPEQLGNDWPLRTPGNARPETWYFKQ
ncbi:Periplasmic alpha-galactoside-binding protein [Thermoflexales bacterium]|nr:Periplasmic alpha-galactoside-binding protein [Thermoflexales bacterium]